MPSISAVIITYNAERRLAQCLASLQGIADETVVLDAYSTDQTQAICRQFAHVRLSTQVFTTYAQQKNDAIALAQHRYILSLDADEVLSNELREQIIQAKQQWGYDAYAFSRRNYCGDYWVRYGGWYPDRKIRLFDRRKARWAGGNPHEYLLLDADARLGRLSGDLLHYTADTLADWIARNERYSTLQAEYLAHSRPRVGWYALFIKPCWRFIRAYLLQGGFLDGKIGFIAAVTAAYGVFARYAKLYR
jgi:glycosyltransferase involved in cell wall biosynthesis